MSNTGNNEAQERQKLIDLYRRRLVENMDFEEKMNEIRKEHTELSKKADKSDEYQKIIQNTGQFIGEILKSFPDDKYIVKTINGSRYLVHCKKAIDKTRLKVGTRVALDFTTLTIMRILPHQIDPQVYNMMTEDPGNVTYSSVGGLSNQIRDLRETIELPITNPELFKRIGIKPPKGVLLYGPPGTGKTLLARVIANSIEATFLKIVASSIIDKYIGESARIVREMFAYAREHEPCIIFIDEIDAIGGKRSDDAQSSDREIHRTLMEMLNQIDGFDELGRVKVIMATNRQDILDTALLRPGRLDRKIEFPYPDRRQKRLIFQVITNKMNLSEDVDLEEFINRPEKISAADIASICQEAGLLAVRKNRYVVISKDFEKAYKNVISRREKSYAFYS